MKTLIFLSLFVLMLGINSNIIHSQTSHQVVLTNFEFTDADITISIGDTVVWINNQGFHDVDADDNNFSSGDPAMPPWTFVHVFTAKGVNPYFCSVHGGQGGFLMSGVVTVMDPVSVSDQNQIVNEFVLEQNYPNPFNPSTIIRYQIAEKSNVILTVYNSIGKEISTLLNEVKPKGTFTIEFDGNNLPSGIYYLRLQAGNFIDTKKMVLLR
ncbi:MAG: T9SS type A sorting domain-containing protein [Bacteroidetes bacterium]|nr:T9SS type A sorting domain-containing protein [Bacteroidota bacterium]